MPTPCLEIQHLKTSTQYERSKLINRYWFQWQNRRQLGALIVRLDLLDADGNVVTKASLQLPKVKITGYVPASDTSPEKPIYDGTVYLQVDDIVREKPAVFFRFYTVTGLLSKSSVAEGVMNGKTEDLTMYG